MTSLPRVGFVQDGARLHYQVPVALRGAGLLDRMFVDWYARPGSATAFVGRAVKLLSARHGRRMGERYCPELDGVPVHTHGLAALARRAARRRFETDEAYFAWEAGQVARWLLTGRRLSGLDVLAGFVRNLHPVAVEGAKARGLHAVADQIIAPATEEAAEARRQADRWPGWEPQGRAADYAVVSDVERRTWAATDHLTCGSDYVRDRVVAAGVQAQQVTVIPYPDAPTRPPQRVPKAGPLTVGFVGAVGLRKGAPYFFEVARRFNPQTVRFVMVGPIVLDAATAARERGAVELVGRVSRGAVREWLDRFDVFFFPSTCEGSAGAVVEAMGAGLPVVTSRNSGSTVRDGVEGFLADYDNVDRYVEVITRLAADDGLRVRLGQAAWERHNDVHHPDRYAAALREVIARLVCKS